MPCGRLRDRQGRDEPPRLVFRSTRSRPWTLSDWLLVVAAVALGATVIGHVVAGALGRR